MKAAYYTHYGPPSQVSVTTVPTPIPKPNEIRVKVHAAAVTAADIRILSAQFPKGFGVLGRLAFGLSKPRNHILGSCYSGVIESVGSKVTDFKVGDRVCGMTGIKMGAHAQYVTVSQSGSVVIKPASVSHEHAAALLFGGTAALYFLRDVAKVTKGETVLINGASGAVGTNAVQLARYFGGTVTAVTSAAHAKLVTNLGAKKIIDYQKEFVLDTKQRFDVILDAVGNFGIRSGMSLLTKKGRIALMVPSLGEMISAGAYKQVLTGTATEKRADIAFLLEMLEKGIITAVIDEVYPLADVVNAYKHASSGSKKGNIVLKIS